MMKKVMANVKDGTRAIVHIFAAVSVCFLYNPFGFSYYDLAKNYTWGADPQSFGIAALGAAIFGITFFMVTESWDLLQVRGKIIIVPLMVCLSGAIVTSSGFNNGSFDHWVSLVLGNIVFFVVAGVMYPRMMWFFFKRRSTDDPDTGDEN